MKFLLSLIPIYGFGGAILVIGTLMGIVPQYSPPAAVITIVVGGIIALVGIISTFSSVFNHVEELGKLVEYRQDVTTADEFLVAAKENIKTVTDVAKDLDTAVLAKSNVDHPAVRAMDTLMSAQKSLQGAKNNVNRTQGQIAARKVGPFGWVVKMYGEG